MEEDNGTPAMKRLSVYLVSRRVLELGIRDINTGIDPTRAKSIMEKLEGKYPEFRMLLREYREGILYFQLMENEIWKPAGEDSVGIQEFYTENRELYKFPGKAEAWVYNVPDSTVLEKLYKAITEDAVNEREFLLKTNSPGPIVPVKVSWEEGQESSWADIPMVTGVYRKVMSDKL